MHTTEIYILLGSILFFVSLVSLSIYLQPNRNEVSGFVSRRTKTALRFGFLVTVLFLYLVVVGVYLLITSNNLIRFMMFAGVVGFWSLLMFINITTIYVLAKNGYRPVLSKDVVDIMMYYAVLYLVLDRFNFPWLAIGVSSIMAAVVILYLLMIAFRYSKMMDAIVEPANLYTLGLGFRIFSGFIGLLLISIRFSENVFKGLIVVSCLFFTLILWDTTRKIKPIVNM
jgi:hypothetical protein